MRISKTSRTSKTRALKEGLGHGDGSITPSGGSATTWYLWVYDPAKDSTAYRGMTTARGEADENAFYLTAEQHATVLDSDKTMISLAEGCQ